MAAIYDKPQVLLRFLSDRGAFGDLIKNLARQDIPRSALRLHMEFVCNALAEGDPELSLVVLVEFVFPHLLFTKPRQKSAIATWSIVLKSALGRQEIFSGMESTLGFLDTQEHSLFDAEKMAALNESISSKMAGKSRFLPAILTLTRSDLCSKANLLSSNTSTSILEGIVRSLKSTDSTNRLISYLLLHDIIKTWPLQKAIPIAREILRNTRSNASVFPRDGALHSDVSCFQFIH